MPAPVQQQMGPTSIHETQMPCCAAHKSALLQQVEACLGELLGLCQRAEEFAPFASAHAAAAGADKQRTEALGTAARGGAFQVAVRELLSYYVHLVSFVSYPVKPAIQPVAEV